MKSTVIVASCKPWHKAQFELLQQSHREVEFIWVSNVAELAQLALPTLQPTYIFFVHWNWRVPTLMIQRYHCICFHMTDLPYGRGGSPLQNIILDGQKSSQLTSLKMTEQFDAGPIYFKSPFKLNGSAEQIYLRAGLLCFKQISQFLNQQPTPYEQQGIVTTFSRRTPEQSEIPANLTTEKLYDYIRMLDAPGYPKAFITKANNRYEFSDAKLCDGQLVAAVKITNLEEKS